MSQNRRDPEQVVAAARKGAAEAQRQQIEIIKQFAAIDCGTGDEEGNARVVEIIDRQLKLIKGIEITHHYAEGYGIHIVARLKPEKPEGKILLSAHTDTVFHRGDTAAYPYHEDGDTAYGLGIVDCKGGILVAIHAVRIMQEADMLPNKEIVFIFNCDEETGTPNGHAVFDTEIPGAEMAFVFEPSRDEDGVLTARKGACSITVEVFGKKAHSGVNYLDGRSATVELGHMLVRLYENNDNVRGIQFNPAALYGGDYGTGIVSDHATAKVGVRVACQADIDKVKEIIARVEKETYIEGTKTEIRIDRISVPMERNEKNVQLYETVHKAGLLLGKDLPEQASGGSGDASYFSYRGVPAVDALGPDMYKIHSTDESMRLSSFEEKTALFAVVLGIL